MGLFDFVGDLFGGGSEQQQQQTTQWGLAPWTGAQQQGQNWAANWLQNYLGGNVDMPGMGGLGGTDMFYNNQLQGGGGGGMARPMPVPLPGGQMPSDAYDPTNRLVSSAGNTQLPWGMPPMAQELIRGDYAAPVYQGQNMMQQGMGALQGAQGMVGQGMDTLSSSLNPMYQGLSALQGGMGTLQGGIDPLLQQLQYMPQLQQQMMGQMPGIKNAQGAIGGMMGQIPGMMGQMAGQIPALNMMRNMGMQQYADPGGSPITQGMYGAYSDLMNKQFADITQPSIQSTGGRYGLTGSSAIADQMGSAGKDLNLNLGSALQNIMSQQQQMGQSTMLQAPQIAGQLGGVYGGLGNVYGGLGNVWGGLQGQATGLGGLAGQLGQAQGGLASTLGQLGLGQGQLGQGMAGVGQGIAGVGQAQGGLGALQGNLGTAMGGLGQGMAGTSSLLSGLAAMSNQMGLTPFQMMLQLAGTGPGAVQTGGTGTGSAQDPSQGLLGSVLGIGGGIGLGSLLGGATGFPWGGGMAGMT